MQIKSLSNGQAATDLSFLLTIDCFLSAEKYFRKPAVAVRDANSLEDIVKDFNALLANLRDAGILER